MNNVDGTLGIRIKEIPIKGYGFHWLLYPLYVGPYRVIIMRDKLFSTLVNIIKDRWGTAGDVTLYRIGETVGEDIYNTAKETYKKNGKDLILTILIIGRLMGWFENTELLEYDKDKQRAKIRLYDNFECRYVNSKTPNSQFLRGTFLGIFKNIFGNEIKITETNCISLGDNYCQFVIKPK